LIFCLKDRPTKRDRPLLLPLQLQPNHGWKYGKAVVAKREPEEPKPLLVQKSPELDYLLGLDKDIINAIGATSLITLVGFAMLQCQVPLSQTPSPKGVFARTDGGAPGGNPGEDLARLARLVCRFGLCAGPF